MTVHVSWRCLLPMQMQRLTNAVHPFRPASLIPHSRNVNAHPPVVRTAPIAWPNSRVDAPRIARRHIKSVWPMRPDHVTDRRESGAFVGRVGSTRPCRKQAQIRRRQSQSAMGACIDCLHRGLHRKVLKISQQRTCSMKAYDPENALKPGSWLEHDEQEPH